MQVIIIQTTKLPIWEESYRMVVCIDLLAASKSEDDYPVYSQARYVCDMSSTWKGVNTTEPWETSGQ